VRHSKKKLIKDRQSNYLFIYCHSLYLAKKQDYMKEKKLLEKKRIPINYCNVILSLKIGYVIIFI